MFFAKQSFPDLFHKDPKVTKRRRIFLAAKDVVLGFVGLHHPVVVAELHLVVDSFRKRRLFSPTPGAALGRSRRWRCPASPRPPPPTAPSPASRHLAPWVFTSSFDNFLKTCLWQLPVILCPCVRRTYEDVFMEAHLESHNRIDIILKLETHLFCCLHLLILSKVLFLLLFWGGESFIVTSKHLIDTELHQKHVKCTYRYFHIYKYKNRN